MPITKYQNELDVGAVGQIATLEGRNIKTRNAEQVMSFGRAVMQGTNKGVDGKNVFVSKAVLTFDADFVTGNTIDLDVNGTSITQVPFDTDQATTLANLISAIDALTGISAVAGSGARDIDITVDDALENITVDNVIVASGASQAGSSVVYNSVDIFEGIAALRHNQPKIVGGDDQYEINDPINVLTKGVIYVEVVATVAYGDSVYVYNDKANSTNQGQFTNNSSGNNIVVSSAKFVSAAVGTIGTPALAKVEINQP
jgi:hypothetical protein